MFSQASPLYRCGDVHSIGLRFYRNGGFSLIELLVSIAIIAVLALLAVGGGSVLSEKRKRVADVSNLKTLGQGLHLYLAENNQMMPSITSPTPLKAIAVQLGIMKTVTEYDGADYTKMDLSIFGPLVSPSDPRKHRSPWNSYGSNYYMGNNPTVARDKQNIHTAYRFSEIVNPSHKLYLLPTETEDNYTGHGRYTEGSPPWNARVGSVAIRFDSSGLTPALFMDGHVSVISLTDIVETRGGPSGWIFPLKDTPL